MIEIPDNYFSNLSSYEEFVIKTNLLGYDVSDKEVLIRFKKVEDYYWLVINGHLCFLDDKGNKAENVILKGSFNCSYNNLKSLEGCPKEVGGDFYCSHNQLTSLEGCPKKIGRDFYCSHNQLISLKGCPKEVIGYFYCHNNSKKLLKPKKLKCFGFYNN